MRISETEKYARFASSGVPGMADILKGGELGDAKISETHISSGSAKLANTLNRNYGHFRILPGKYVRLHVNGKLMMSDTPMERITNSGFLHAASGRVLIAGLGIGLIIRPIIKSPKVKQIVVVEKSADVIKLVGDQLFENKVFGRAAKEKMTVIHGDIFNWSPSTGEKFDTIYFDIWPEISTDNIDEINLLRKKFRKHLSNDNGWMGAWMHEQLLKMRRQERRNGWV